MKTTYKQIIKNMVERKVNEFIEERYTGNPSQEITLDNTDDDLGYPSFKSVTRINYIDYEFNGYIDEYGCVHISSISFEYDYFKNNEDMEKGKVSYSSNFLYGTQLDKFAFKN